MEKRIRREDDSQNFRSERQTQQMDASCEHGGRQAIYKREKNSGRRQRKPELVLQMCRAWATESCRAISAEREGSWPALRPYVPNIGNEDVNSPEHRIPHIATEVPGA